MTPESLAAFIGRHHPAACVEISADTLTVVSTWTMPGTRRWGWRIERIPATWADVRKWLGY